MGKRKGKKDGNKHIRHIIHMLTNYSSTGIYLDVVN